MTEPDLTPLDAEVLEHVIYKLANAHINLYPYPHFLIRDVFPADFYGDLARRVMQESDYATQEGRYNGRTFGPENMIHFEGLRGLVTKRFLRAAMTIFRPQIIERYGENPVPVYSDLRFIRDGKGYFIGPHTDARWKLISFLFYLPIHDMYARHGTSIYIPNDPRIVCEGGPHHAFEHFTRVFTAPYLPNTLFGFWKTNKAFHGVEPIADDFQREVLLWNCYDKEIYELTHKKPSNDGKDEQPAASASPEQ